MSKHLRSWTRKCLGFNWSHLRADIEHLCLVSVLALGVSDLIWVSPEKVLGRFGPLEDKPTRRMKDVALQVPTASQTTAATPMSRQF